MTLLKRQPRRVIKGQSYLPSDFAYVPTPRLPNTWKFLLTDAPGKTPTRKAVDAAVKAVSNYDIPDDALESVLDKLRDAWRKAYPGKPEEDMPNELSDGEVEEDVEDEGEANVNMVDAGTSGRDDLDDDEDSQSPDLDEEQDDSNAITGEAEGAGTGEGTGEGDPDDSEIDPVTREMATGATEEDDEEDDEDKDERFASKLLKRWIDPMDGAVSFMDVLAERNKESKSGKLMEATWPIISALDTSLRSIIADQELDETRKMTDMRMNVEMFLAKIREAMPEVEQILADMLDVTVSQKSKGKTKMKPIIKNTLAPVASAGKVSELEKSLAALTKKFEDSETARKTAEAELMVTKKVAELTEDERALYDKCADAKAKTDFLALEKSARASLVKKAVSEDEALEVGGVTILKSATDPSMFAIFKAQAARTTELEKSVSEERAKTRQLELRKRAEDELGTMPGTLDEKIALLKSLDSMPEDVRKTATSLFEAASKTANLAFTRMGSAGGVNKGKSSDFEKKVTEIRKRDTCTRQQAMTKARHEFPDEFRDWQGTEVN